MEKLNDDKTRKIFISNLPIEATQKDLIDHFKKFGNIKVAKLTLDKGMNFVYGFISFENTDARDIALAAGKTQYLK